LRGVRERYELRNERGVRVHAELRGQGVRGERRLRRDVRAGKLRRGVALRERRMRVRRDLV
jgi:hypothetical protein